MDLAKGSPSKKKGTRKLVTKASTPTTTGPVEIETTVGLPSAKDMKKGEFFEENPLAGESPNNDFQNLVKTKLMKIENSLGKMFTNLKEIKSVRVFHKNKYIIWQKI